jgi:hypothetical protein
MGRRGEVAPGARATAAHGRRKEGRMSAAGDPLDAPMTEWALEPVDDADTSTAPAAEPPAGRAHFHAESRSNVERRSGSDRRQALRFEADRRTGIDRRPRRGWEPGKNL